MSPVEPYLGDCIGDPAIYRPVIKPRRRYGWIENGLAMLFGWIGVAVYAAVIVAALALVFVQFARQNAYGIELRQYQVPKACAALAERYGFPAVLTYSEAAKALAQLDANSWWPGVSQCRKAAHKEWRL